MDHNPGRKPWVRTSNALPRAAGTPPSPDARSRPSSRCRIKPDLRRDAPHGTSCTNNSVAPTARLVRWRLVPFLHRRIVAEWLTIMNDHGTSEGELGRTLVSLVATRHLVAVFRANPCVRDVVQALVLVTSSYELVQGSLVQVQACTSTSVQATKPRTSLCELVQDSLVHCSVQACTSCTFV